jgi:hypothetical protein
MKLERSVAWCQELKVHVCDSLSLHSLSHNDWSVPEFARRLQHASHHLSGCIFCERLAMPWDRLPVIPKPHFGTICCDSLNHENVKPGTPAFSVQKPTT